MKFLVMFLAFTFLTVVSPELGFDANHVYAQKKKKKKRSKKRKKRNNRGIVETRRSFKKGDQTKIDLDGVDLTGNRKTPLGSLIDSTKPNRDYDFIKLRMQWVPEMIQSASSMEKGTER